MKKRAYQLKPALKQKQTYSRSYDQTLTVLKMSNQQIRRELLSLLQPNPWFPSGNDEILKQIHAGAEGGVRADLYYQLHTCRQAYDPQICSYLIESLDHHGFFPYHQEQPFPYPKAQVDAALRLIQSFEPEGIATENSTDFLCFQLRRRKLTLPLKIVTDCAEELISGHGDAILRQLDITADQLEAALATIRTCRLTPCEIEPPLTEWIKPDVYVTRSQNELIVTPAIEELPLFPIPADQLSPQAQKYLKQNNLLLDMINQRNLTLLQIFHALITIQRDYLLKDQPLKPCRLEDVSVLCGVHPSTISRCCKNKYYEFEGQLACFTTLLASGNIQGHSHDEIHQLLNEELAMEDPDHPYSDDQLLQLLVRSGIQLSRREITKLRKKWNIPNSYQRRRRI